MSSAAIDSQTTHHDYIFSCDKYEFFLSFNGSLLQSPEGKINEDPSCEVALRRGSSHRSWLLFESSTLDVMEWSATMGAPSSVQQFLLSNVSSPWLYMVIVKDSESDNNELDIVSQGSS
jgi:hypothetical protein